MASREVGSLRSGSPNENFEPLDDDMQSSGDESDEEASESEYRAQRELELSSLELDVDAMDVMGTTPPVNSRAMKRAKEKDRSVKLKIAKKDMKDMKMIERAEKKRIVSRTPVTGGENLPDMMDLKIDDDLEQWVEPKSSLETNSVSRKDPGSAKKRKDSTRTIKTSRAQERDYKNSSSSISSLDPPPKPVKIQSIQVDTPNRFLSLQFQSRPLVTSPVSGESLSLGSFNKRRHPPEIPACPQDRAAFHRIFSMLISIGNTERKERENRKVSPYVRQLSSEQEVFQTRLNDLLWLELQAWHHSRTMQEQDEYLCCEREKIDTLLEEVMHFRFQDTEDGNTRSPGESEENHTGTCSTLENCTYGSTADGIEISGPQELCAQIADEDSNIKNSTSDSFVHVCPSSEIGSDQKNIGISQCKSCDNDADADINFIRSVSAVDVICQTPVPPSLHLEIERQKSALLEVSKLLDRLEKAEKLYPTSKALGREHPLYLTDAFQQRVRTLCLWTNITKDLAHKLQLMAKLFHLEQIGAIDWPWLDYQSPVQLLQEIRSAASAITPDIVVTDVHDEDEDDSYSDEDEPQASVNTGSSTWVRVSNIGNSERSVEKNVRFEMIDSSPSSPSSPESAPTNLFNMTPPSDTSTPARPPGRTVSISSSFSQTNSSFSVLDSTCRTSIYRYYVDRTLKKTGLWKMMERLQKLLTKTLMRARTALETPPLQPSYAEVLGQETAAKSPDITPQLSASASLVDLPQYLSAETTWQARRGSMMEMGMLNLDLQLLFKVMGLPSFKPTYLFLVRLPLDVVHECLRLRLEQQPENDPSLLSVRQLIRECREVLRGSVLIKQIHYSMVAVVATDSESETFEGDLEQFEEDMKTMLEVYFNYIQSWMFGLQSLPEMSKRLKNALEEEWNFTKHVCPHIRGGEANAGKRFCLMASSLLHSISDYLETGMDECIDQLYDSTTFDHMAEEDMQLSHRGSRSVELRQAIIQTCRKFKELFHEARERASKALGFAKMLRKDLEIAADYNIAVTAPELLKTLEDTCHVQVVAPHSTGYLMFIPRHIADDRTMILHLLNITCGREDVSQAATSTQEGYLLLVKCEGCLDGQKVCPRWAGATLNVEPTAETTIALSHIEVEGLLLVVMRSSQLSQQRELFQDLVGSAVSLVSENTSCHQAIAESLAELKNAAMNLREKVASAIICVDEKLNLQDIPEMDEGEKINIQKLYQETLHQCYNFGFEYHKELTRLVSGEMRCRLARNLVSFAKQWMKFVFDKCERGRGRRPRWANTGLDFLIEACEPRVLAMLTDEEFAELKISINNCISHVIGDKTGHGSPGYRVSSPDTSSGRQMLRNMSWPDGPRTVPSRQGSSSSVKTTISEPSTPFPAEPGSRHSGTAESVVLHEGEDGGIVIDVNVKEDEEKSGPSNDRGRMNQIFQSVQHLEQERTNKLYAKNVIGRVTNQKVEVDYHVSIRKVNFRWQRGIKIGEGQFGKVYTAVNVDSGELMAMKEIRFQPNDHQTVKDIADEIKIFESISHPSLVKYYGVEVHRDEMLIFMEYCTEGTIEEVAKLGLAEVFIRKYTSQILQAVVALHEKGIVHRDIKGANIFLTSDGLKLGDFGCSVKLKNHTTMPGEVKNLAGTTAFMAPEVITNNPTEGTGRAADVWSVACVVIEMATGKRPWHELENNFMIMFRVGMGGTPQVPDSLSAEGKDFLSHCLSHDPKERWTASQLLDHPFVKVYSDDENDEDENESSV